MARFDAIAHLVKRIEELERRHANQERHGKITDVDNDKGLVKFSDGVFSSDWLEWHEHNSNGGMKTRSMPQKGAGVVARAMSGNMENGSVTYGIYPSANNPMPDAKNGEHVTQMGADDPTKGKQVKTITDVNGNHSVAATDSHTKSVGAYSHTMTKDGGHVFTAGGTPPTTPGGPVTNPTHSYTMTAAGGHVMTSGGVSMTMDHTGVAYAGGKITHDGDIIDKTHKHKDSQPGAGLTGEVA